MQLFRQLSAAEESEFRLWARENYRRHDPINGVWHPVIQAECVAMNAEGGLAPVAPAPLYTPPLFDVTYEIVSEESSQHGEAEEHGYIAEAVSLRDALRYVRETRTNHVGGVECVECDSSPAYSPRWVTVTNSMEYLTGDCESRSLHMPETLTDATRRRIARLCGADVPPPVGVYLRPIREA